MQLTRGNAKDLGKCAECPTRYGQVFQLTLAGVCTTICPRCAIGLLRLLVHRKEVRP